jgi:hypothetical protein
MFTCVNTTCWDVHIVMKLRYVYKHDTDGLLFVANTQKRMEREVLSSLATGPTAHRVASEKKTYLIFILKKA